MASPFWPKKYVNPRPYISLVVAPDSARLTARNMHLRKRKRVWVLVKRRRLPQWNRRRSGQELRMRMPRWSCLLKSSPKSLVLLDMIDRAPRLTMFMFVGNGYAGDSKWLLYDTRFSFEIQTFHLSIDFLFLVVFGSSISLSHFPYDLRFF